MLVQTVEYRTAGGEWKKDLVEVVNGRPKYIPTHEPWLKTSGEYKLPLDDVPGGTPFVNAGVVMTPDESRSVGEPWEFGLAGEAWARGFTPAVTARLADGTEIITSDNETFFCRGKEYRGNLIDVVLAIQAGKQGTQVKSGDVTVVLKPERRQGVDVAGR